MNIELINVIIPIITSGLGGGISWLFARKKYKAEVDSNIISNMQESLTFYKDAIENNKVVLKDVQKENNELREENKRLQIQIDDYEDKLRDLMKLNDNLTMRIEKLESLVKNNNKPKKK